MYCIEESGHDVLYEESGEMYCIEESAHDVLY
jgi:hypothetical protein